MLDHAETCVVGQTSISFHKGLDMPFEKYSYIRPLLEICNAPGASMRISMASNPVTGSLLSSMS